MFRFYSSPQNKTRIVVVGEHSEGVLKVAVSRCSKKDQFVRKKGRFIAESRLSKNRLYLKEDFDHFDAPMFLNMAKNIEQEMQTSKEVVNENYKKNKSL